MFLGSFQPSTHQISALIREQSLHHITLATSPMFVNETDEMKTSVGALDVARLL